MGGRGRILKRWLTRSVGKPVLFGIRKGREILRVKVSSRMTRGK